MPLPKSNLTWVADPAFKLNFTNCTEAVYLWRSFDPRRYVVNTTLVDQYLLNIVKSYFKTNHLAQPDMMDITQWRERGDVEMPVKDYTEENCVSELCPWLGWEGNSDVAGLGMLTAYVTQASLVTFYLFALLMIRFERPQALQNTPWIFRILRATQHSTSNFLNASFLFCIAMLLASVVQFSQLLRGTTAMTSTAVAVSMLMTFNSVLPVVVLQLAASNVLRRLHGRAVLWALLAIMTSVVLGLGVKSSDSYPSYLINISSGQWFGDDAGERIKSQFGWEARCYDATARIHLQLFACFVGGSLTLSIAGYLFTVIARSTWHFSKSSSRLKRLSRMLWWTGLVLAWCTMWLSIGWFIRFQGNLEQVAGEDNKDTEWSFGQVLALATWAPVVVEFAYLWYEGPTEALTGRLMEPYEVIEVSKKKEAYEPNRGTATV